MSPLLNDWRFSMMQRLQMVFNHLIGIHQHEAMLRARAREIFEGSSGLPEAIEVPAYLRRKTRIRQCRSSAFRHLAHGVS
jgi:hypothetical protein